ncbi:MAG: hypothetical protein V3V18_05955 [Methylococcales bacterium]
MTVVQTSDETIEELVVALIQLVQGCGGFIHPALKIVSTQGEFSLALDKKLEPKTCVLRVPFQCMPVIEGFDLTYQQQTIVVTPKTEVTDAGVELQTELQVSCMDILVRLYNHTNKIEEFSRVSPVLALRQHPKLLGLLATAVGQQLSDFDVLDKLGMLNLAVYLKSRVFHRSDVKGSRLLPLIDFADHAIFADPLRIGDGGVQSDEFMQINYMPVDNSLQCFVSYSMMDCLDSYMSYGYVDKTAFFVKSLPFTVELEGFGTFSVERWNVNASQLDPAEWDNSGRAASFYAANFTASPQQIEVRFVLIPPVEHMEAFDEVLGLYLTECEQVSSSSEGKLNTSENKKLIMQAMLKVNLDFYMSLQVHILTGLADDKASAVLMLKQMIQKQLDIILEFKRGLEAAYKQS